MEEANTKVVVSHFCLMLFCGDPCRQRPRWIRGPKLIKDDSDRDALVLNYEADRLRVTRLNSRDS